MSTFIINGRNMGNLSGGSFSMIDGDLIVNGKRVDLESFGDAKVFNITVHGDVDSIDGTFSEITVNGNAGSARSRSGNVTVTEGVSGSAESVSGNVRIGGSVTGNAKSVSGKIVIEGDVHGKVSTVSGKISR